MHWHLQSAVNTSMQGSTKSNGIAILLLEVNYTFLATRGILVLFAGHIIGADIDWHNKQGAFSVLHRTLLGFGPTKCHCLLQWVAEMGSPHVDNGIWHGQSKIKSMSCAAGLIFKTIAFVVTAVKEFFHCLLFPCYLAFSHSLHSFVLSYIFIHTHWCYATFVANNIKWCCW